MIIQPHILFITATRLGDAVLSTGILDHLCRTWPDAKIHVACGRLPAPIFEACPQVVRVIPLDKRPHGGHWLDLWRVCHDLRWDMIVDLRDSIMPFILRARRRVRRVKAKTPMTKVAELGACLRLETPPSPRLWLTSEVMAEAETIIGDKNRPLLAVGPAANWKRKAWRPERFAEAIARLTALDGPLPEARVMILAASHEAEQIALVCESIPKSRRLELTGYTDLLLSAACLAQADFYLGNDSGLMHIAAAMGVPTLGLFGPTRSDVYAPWGPHTDYVRTVETAEALLNAPDFSWEGGSLMDSLTVDKVVSAAEELITRVSGRLDESQTECNA